MSRNTRYSPELRERAVRMAIEKRADYPSEWATFTGVAKLFGMSPGNTQDLGPPRPGRSWHSGRSHHRRACSLEGPRAREPRPAARERDLEGRLDFLRDRARRSNEEVVRYIDSRRERWGVEPICKALQFAPATYYAIHARPESARRQRDETLKSEIQRVYDASLDGVYGAKKVWKQLNREGVRVARCTTERLMKELGLSGVQKGRRYKVTTIGDESLQRPSDLVDRHFVAAAPNRLWVADLTYVKSHSGWVYVAFIIDVFSRFIVGWQVSNSLRSDLAIDALEMAIFARGDDLVGLVHHSDRGVNTSAFVTPNDWTRPAPLRQLDRRATAMTMHWPSHSTPSTRAS